MTTFLLLIALLAVPAAAGAQPFEDARAQALWEAAVDHRMVLDEELLEYRALVRQRFGAGLRMPLKDRTLYRAEGATRVLWTRGGTTVVQVLAGREQTPVGEGYGVAHLGLFDMSFDPLNDRLFLGLVESDGEVDAERDDFWFEHPLEPIWRDGYSYATGDSLALTLPSGERVRVVELEVVPVVADVHRMVGSLWIEPESGALVRAVYRLSETFDPLRDVRDLEEEEGVDQIPGILQPMTFDLSMVAVEYSWWEGDVWLPRVLRAEGTARAGILRAPATLEVSYRVEDVRTRADAEAEAASGATADSLHFATRSEAMEWIAGRLQEEAGLEVPYGLSPSVRSSGSDEDGDARTTLYLVPDDTTWLAESPHLPPPVWEADAAFADADELREWEDLLGELPAPPVQGLPRTFRWGLQRSDLVRYNRIEALSVGARGQIRPQTPLGPLSVTATGRLGVGDLQPNARLDIVRESLARRLTLSGFHELTAVDERARHLGPGNSLTALLFGRDDGDYFRRSGVAFTWAPPEAERPTFELRASAEYHRPVAVETDFALWNLTSDGRSFRPNLQAREGWEYGGRLILSPWWGSDPRLAQGGMRLQLRGGEGDWRYAQASLENRLVLPLPSGLRLGLEAGGGTSWGDPPPQRAFLLGGAHTLRGYGPRAVEAHTYLRARTEVGRHLSFGTVSVFGDAAWGAPERTSVDADDILWALGGGISILDGLIRLDGAWALQDPRGFRLELYLDGIL